MADRIAVLERVIAYLDTLYEQGDDCVHPDTGVPVSDGEYDALRRELAQLSPNSAIFKSATASNLNTAAKKIKHDPPLTSISKASHEDRSIQEGQLFKWISDCVISSKKYDRWFDLDKKNIDGVDHEERVYNGAVVKYPAATFYQTYKLDGVACALYYKNGDLVAAGLRPRDGVNGEDVTEQVKYVAGIPQKLKLPVTCSIRGELICKLSDFEEVQKELTAAGEKLRANP